MGKVCRPLQVTSGRPTPVIRESVSLFGGCQKPTFGASAMQAHGETLSFPS